MNPLESKRQELLDEIGSIDRLRRGQLSEQYIEKPATDGTMKRYGPYYVWQASINGKKRSHRIDREAGDQVREELAAYKRYEKLCDELADVTEQLTCSQQSTHSKKKPRRVRSDWARNGALPKYRR